MLLLVMILASSPQLTGALRWTRIVFRTLIRLGRSRSSLSQTVLLVLVSLAWTIPATAQFSDSFEDGDFTTAPNWIGDTDRWQIGELDGHSLQSMGGAEADTIHLAIPSDAAYGSWQLTFAHAGVNLSSFNGARVFFVSDRADARQGAVGYYLQLGTNNSDTISLWRSDGDLSTQRTEIARSDDAKIAGESSLVRLRVDRDGHGDFHIYANDSLLFVADDIRYSESAYFVLWIKHTAQGADAFFFDSISFEPVAYNEPPVPLPDSADVVINEIQFDPAPGASEFIEIYNRGTTPIGLSSLRIRDSRSGDVAITSRSSQLAPEAFAVLVQDSASFATEFRFVPFIAVSGWPALNNGGDTVVLSTTLGTMDSLQYGAQIGIRGRSLERIDPEGPTEMSNFSPSIDGFGSTPGERNSVYTVDNKPPRIMFVEQIDSLTLDVHFSEAVRTNEIVPETFTYSPTITAVAPLNDSIIRLKLLGAPVDALIYADEVRDPKGNTSGVLGAPVAFLANPTELIVNEIMYEPRASAYDSLPDQIEFVELVNRSNRMISVTELIRTRKVDELNDADSLRFGKPTISVKPGGFLVITPADSIGMRDAYPGIIPNELSVYVSAPGLTLLNSGDILRIHNRHAEVLDEVEYSPAWHHPDLSERRGVSLERIDIQVSSRDPMNWSSSVSDDGATPGTANSVLHAGTASTEEYGIAIEPSPFSPDGDGHEDVAVITYRLRAQTPSIRVRIFDINGVEKRRLVPAELVSSEGRILWDGRDDSGRLLRIGIYIAVLESIGGGRGGTEMYKRPLVLARKR